MGEVWLSRQRSSGTLSAIKVVRSDRFADNTRHRELCMERLRCEARALGKLRSPNIVRILDSGVTASGAFYYAMEYLEGTSLEELIDTRGALPWQQAVPLLRDIGTALSEVHAHGLIHCDVSPGNVLVCPSVRGTVTKLLDFGMVRTAHAAETTTQISLPPTAAGTPAYIPPEVVLGRTSIDHRTDLYSWACVGYTLLTGQTVFEGDSPIGVAIAHVTETPLPLTRRTDQPIPAALEALVLRCLAKNPVDRPDSMLDVTAELDAIQRRERPMAFELSVRLPPPNLTAQPPACHGPIA
jgi:serine/threonine-protein kinase